MTSRPATDAELDDLEAQIDRWLATWKTQQQTDEPPAEQPAEQAEEQPAAPPDRPLLLDVQRDEDIARRWYVRLAGDTRDVIAIWLTLRQRTLAYETYVLPAPPPDRAAEAHEFTLRRNYQTVGAQYAIGPEDALFLKGELPTFATDEAELDRIVGSLWTYVERDFQTLLRLCFDVGPNPQRRPQPFPQPPPNAPQGQQ